MSGKNKNKPVIVWRAGRWWWAQSPIYAWAGVFLLEARTVRELSELVRPGRIHWITP